MKLEPLPYVMELGKGGREASVPMRAMNTIVG